MARALLLSAVLVALAAGLGYWFLGSPGDSGEPGDAVAPAARTDPGRTARTEAQQARPQWPEGPETSETEAQIDAAQTVDPGSAGRDVLEPDRPAVPDGLGVRVLDATGAPASGVPLLLKWRKRELELQTTDRGGRARFQDVRPAAAAGEGTQLLFHCLPFAELPVLALDGAALAAGEVQSVLPPTGSVEVIVRELDGRPAAAGTGVELTLVDEQREAVNPLLAESRPRWAIELRDGRAVFPYVELGRTWEVLARRPQASAASRARGRGPTRAGERASLLVELGSDHPAVRYRAVDAAGTPFAEVALKVRRQDGFFSRELVVETDAGGWFVVDLEGAWFLGSGTIVAAYKRGDGSLLRGRADLVGGNEAGLHEGGDVVLLPDDLLVAGIVVDETGAPVAGATVTAGARGFGRPMFVEFGGGVRGESDGSGRFELRGLLERESFDVQAFQGRRESEPVRVREGSRDVRVALSPRWRLRGRLLVDPGISPDELQVDLEADGEELGLDASIQGEGAFQLQGAAAGTYGLFVALGDERLVEIPSLHVAGDVELGSIDLRGRVTRHRIELVGGGGSDELRGDLAWRPAGSQDAWTSRSFDGRQLAILTPDPSIDVWVRPERYRNELTTGVTGSRRVVLRAPLAVVLELQTSGELPAYPYVFDPQLSLDGLRVGFPEGAPYFTAQNRAVRFLVSQPGRIRVQWHLERHGESWAVGGHVLRGHELEIDVLDLPGEQVFQLPLDGEALTRLARNPPY